MLISIMKLLDMHVVRGTTSKVQFCGQRSHIQTMHEQTNVSLTGSANQCQTIECQQSTATSDHLSLHLILAGPVAQQ